MKEALYYTKLKNGRVKCILCPHACELVDGERGKCFIRMNRGGLLYALTYGKVSAVAVDPIEKKPLYHFYPGSSILSIGGIGCNFNCRFCQNWHLVEAAVSQESLSPEGLVKLIEESQTIGIAYTYNEPLIWFEYLMDTAPLIREKGYRTVLVTNGYINPKPFKELSPYIDAMNIDLKTMSEEYCKNVCDGRVKPVLNTIEKAFEKGILVEVTHLMITDETDSIEEIKKIVDFISNISPSIPLHLSRYFPQRNYFNPPTPVERIERAVDVAREKLYYVYAGNVEIDGAGNTYCPSCRNTLIERRGYLTKIKGLTSERNCSSCGRKIEVIK